MRVMRVNCYRR